MKCQCGKRLRKCDGVWVTEFRKGSGTTRVYRCDDCAVDPEGRGIHNDARERQVWKSLDGPDRAGVGTHLHYMARI